MKKWLLGAVTGLIVVAVVALYFIIPKQGGGLGPPSHVESTGGKYNATISSWASEDWYAHIEYTNETGKHSEMYFNLKMRDGLDWIRNNTPQNTTILCWWEDGHMIKGYTERDVVIRNPSHETLNSVANPSGVVEFDPNEKIVEVAKAFTANDSTEMISIMNKYDADYVFVSLDFFNRGAAIWLYDAAGLDWNLYLYAQNSTWQFSEAGQQTMFSKLIGNRGTGLSLVYQDETMIVYRKSQP